MVFEWEREIIENTCICYIEKMYLQKKLHFDNTKQTSIWNANSCIQDVIFLYLVNTAHKI